MKRSQHSVYYDTRVEPHLAYDGPSALHEYAAEVQRVDTLPSDDLVLLKQLRAFMSFVEDLVDHVYNQQLDDEEHQSPIARAIAAEEKRMRRLSLACDGNPRGRDIDVSEMLGVAWYFHKLVRARKKETTGLHANALLLSWSAYCKLFHLYVVTGGGGQRYQTLKDGATASQFLYCQFVSEREGVNAVVSFGPIMQYTVTNIWAAVRRVVPSLYQHQYHPEMKSYLHALFFRYCDLFCAAQPAGTSLERVLDHPSFSAKMSVAQEEEERAERLALGGDPHEHYDSYRDVFVRVSPEHVLKSEYFYEGELLFFFQLARLRLTEQLHEQHLEHPLVLATSLSMMSGGDDGDEDVLKGAMAKTKEMLSQLALNPYIKKTIREEYKRDIMSIYLYHGEKERYTRRHPTSPNGASDVLTACRNNDHMNALAMQKATLVDIIDNLFEREVFLIARHATHQWFKLEQVKAHLSILNAFVIEEMATLEDLERLVVLNEEYAGGRASHVNEKDVPVLLRFVACYYVLYKGSVYKGDRFIDSYMVWYNLLLHGSAQLISIKTVHPTIRDELTHFVPILS